MADSTDIVRSSTCIAPINIAVIKYCKYRFNDDVILTSWRTGYMQ